jgi:hypothetical protein
LDFFIPSVPGEPGLLRRSGDYDRFAAELAEALGDAVHVRETAFRDIAPDGATLVHAAGDMTALATLHGRPAFHDTIFLGVRPGDVEALLRAFDPAGVADSSALALWRKRRTPDKTHSGIVVRRTYLAAIDGEGRDIEGLPFATALNVRASLSAFLAGYVRALKTR